MHAERLLMWLLVGAIAVGCALVLYPFVSALLWAAILVFTTWPVFEWLRAQLHLRSSLAAAAMVLLTAIVLVLPLGLAAPSGADDVAQLRHVALNALRAGLPDAPGWIFEVPLIGPVVGDLWNRWAADISVMLDALRPYFGILLEGGLGVLLGIANGVLMFVLALFVAFFFYAYGDPIAERLRVLLQRIAGAQADRLIVVTGATVRGVVYGVLGTAIVQGILTGVRTVDLRGAAPRAAGRDRGPAVRAADRRTGGVDPGRAVAGRHRAPWMGHLPGDLWHDRDIRRRQHHPAVVHLTWCAVAVHPDCAGRIGRGARFRAAGDFPRSRAAGRRLHAAERVGARG